jgi:hypothetical protein
MAMIAALQHKWCFVVETAQLQTKRHGKPWRFVLGR